MRFAKYHGLGNDFLVVDLRAIASSPEATAIQDPKHVVALCDRQFGVGGDGVLAILPSTVADARMRVLNSDGSEAEMCGNGLRCVVIELHDRLGLHQTAISVETGAGVLACTVNAGGTVTVRMGAPRLTRSEIPMSGPAAERCLEQPLAIAGQPPRPVTGVSMGNPHAITFVGSAAEARTLATSIGPTVEKHAWFPAATNVEYAFARSRTEIDLVVWERGCGLTLACGTGACATAVAAVLTGRADENTPIAVNLPGGSLSITVLPNLENVLMTGPALHVFDGTLDLATLAPRPSAA